MRVSIHSGLASRAAQKTHYLKLSQPSADDVGKQPSPDEPLLGAILRERRHNVLVRKYLRHNLEID
jgi:hypothetical protein